MDCGLDDAEFWAYTPAMHLALLDRLKEIRHMDQMQLASVASFFANSMFRSKDSDPTYPADMFICGGGEQEPEVVDDRPLEEMTQAEREMTLDQTFEYMRLQNKARGGVEVIIE